MTDQAEQFTTIERAIVDWLEASGHVVTHDDGDWVLLGPQWPFVKQEISVTSLACAIHTTLESKQ